MIVLCDYTFLGKGIFFTEGRLIINGVSIEKLPSDLREQLMKDSVYVDTGNPDRVCINGYEYINGEFKKTIYSRIKYMKGRWKKKCLYY